MRRNLNRRDVVKGTAKLALAGAFGARRVALARAEPSTRRGAGALAQLDTALRAAANAQELPGVVALAATDGGMLYEGVFGRRRLDGGPAMTRDTVFRVASMIKPITSVAALQLVEQGKLSLDAPVPDIDAALASPQVLDGFDGAGAPRLRPAVRPIALHHLLTHTSGFAYRLWDSKALAYFNEMQRLPLAQRSKLPKTPLMFDPGQRWQYGTSIDWVGRIVEAISGEPLDRYFRRNILDPLGMHDTSFVISPQQRAREASVHRREADGSLKPQPMETQAARRTFSGGGGIYSSGPDYLTFIRMLLNGGSFNGARVLRPDTVALMGQNQIGAVEAGILKTTAPAISGDVDFFPGVDLKWGFGHMINMQAIPGGRSAGSLTWAGLFNTYYWIDPRRHIAAVFMTQVLPFADERALRVYRAFERGVYTAANAG
jgi:methyl acetate hydrolase